MNEVKWLFLNCNWAKSTVFSIYSRIASSKNLNYISVDDRGRVFIVRRTIVDIAQAANVSKATVDRVLNDRPNVGAKTRQRVLEIAAELGYSLKGVPIRAPGVITHTLDIILPAGKNTYMKNLQKELHEQAGMRPGCDLRVHSIEGFNAERLAAAIDGLATNSTAIALVGIDHPLVREAIRKASESGVRFVTLVSDIHDIPRAHYVGIDNRAAGRLAGLLMGRLIRSENPARVAMIAGSRLYRAHEEREAGFRSILGEQFKYITALNPVEVRDDFIIAAEETRHLLEENDALAGIYSIGAGNRGVAEALKLMKLNKRTVVIVHELTRFSRESLLNGTFDVVLDQNPALEASITIDSLTENTSRHRGYPLVEPRIYFSENIG